MTEPALGMRTVFLVFSVSEGADGSSQKNTWPRMAGESEEDKHNKQVLLGKSGWKGQRNLPKSSHPKTSRITLSLTAHKQSPACQGFSSLLPNQDHRIKDSPYGLGWKGPLKIPQSNPPTMDRDTYHKMRFLNAASSWGLSTTSAGCL